MIHTKTQGHWSFGSKTGFLEYLANVCTAAFYFCSGDLDHIVIFNFSIPVILAYIITIQYFTGMLVPLDFHKVFIWDLYFSFL